MITQWPAAVKVQSTAWNCGYWLLRPAWLLRPPMVMILDCGGVLSSTDSKVKQDGLTIWKAAQPGAWAFLRCFWAKYGRDKLHVISRVNAPNNAQHWVVRFCQAMQMDTENVHLVRHAADKGEVSKNLRATNAVEDSTLCLYHMTFANHVNWKYGILFDKHWRSTNKPYDGWRKAKTVLNPNKAWDEIAKGTNCWPGPKIWDTLVKNGPPYAEASDAVADGALRQHCFDGDSDGYTYSYDYEYTDDEGSDAPAASADRGPMADSANTSKDVEPDQETAASAGHTTAAAAGQTEDQAAGETPPTAEQSPRLQSPPAPESEPPVLHQHVHAKGKPEPSRLTLTPGPGARMTQDDEGPVDREDFNDVVSAVRDLTGEVRTLAEKLREQQRSGHRSADSGWLSRKRQRAADYRASGGRAPRPATEMSLPMCVHCKRNQRGVSCSSQMCRLCCQSDACQQHGRR